MSNPCGILLPVALSYLYSTDMLKHFAGKTSIQTQTRIKLLTSHNPALCSFNPRVKLCRDMHHAHANKLSVRQLHLVTSRVSASYTTGQKVK